MIRPTSLLFLSIKGNFSTLLRFILGFFLMSWFHVRSLLLLVWFFLVPVWFWFGYDLFTVWFHFDSSLVPVWFLLGSGLVLVWFRFVSGLVLFWFRFVLVSKLNKTATKIDVYPTNRTFIGTKLTQIKMAFFLK